MKKAWIYTVALAIMSCTLFTSCDFSSSRNYMGTMAGAEIGGVIGEALGWMSTDRHDGPGRAMLGSVIGTIAVAAIGNAVTRDRTEQTVTTSRRSDDIYSNNDYADGYQTGGGYSNGNGAATNKNYSNLSIAGINYQDEDGDGRFSRNETINIIYEVTNHSSMPCTVELKVEAMNDAKSFALSPASSIKIGARETIRYKAKAFCKGRTSTSTAKFKLIANSSTAGSVSSELQIRMSK